METPWFSHLENEHGQHCSVELDSINWISSIAHVRVLAFSFTGPVFGDHPSCITHGTHLSDDKMKYNGIVKECIRITLSEKVGGCNQQFEAMKYPAYRNKTYFCEIL